MAAEQLEHVGHEQQILRTEQLCGSRRQACRATPRVRQRANKYKLKYVYIYIYIYTYVYVYSDIETPV